MRIGVLDLIIDGPPTTQFDAWYGRMVKRVYYGIMPQVVAVWCQEIGHRVFYATYYGQQEPEKLLPDDLDIVFISSFTKAAPLAYALAKIYRRRKTITVLGGPHAKSFPTDALRFFDIVVQDCDKTTIRDVLKGRANRKTVVNTGKPLLDFPSVEKRMPYIRVASRNRRNTLVRNISLLSSVGCPYACDFCVDWRTPYSVLPHAQLTADLRYIADNLPKSYITFHDPNFGVQFDRTLNCIEGVSSARKTPYVIESTLSLLREPRLKRLRETRCIYAAPGIESWAAYSEKSGAGRAIGQKKFDELSAHLRLIRRYIPGVHANIILGCDQDIGDEPEQLTMRLIRELPEIWTNINIPTPFAGTPLYTHHSQEGRILAAMPFNFYYTPYLVLRLAHFSPLAYYGMLVRLFSALLSFPMLCKKLRYPAPLGLRAFTVLRTLGAKGYLTTFRRIAAALKSDVRLRDFHDDKSSILPEFYRRDMERRLGPYATLLSEEERRPILESASNSAG